MLPVSELYWGFHEKFILFYPGLTITCWKYKKKRVENILPVNEKKKKHSESSEGFFNTGISAERPGRAD